MKKKSLVGYIWETAKSKDFMSYKKDRYGCMIINIPEICKNKEEYYNPTKVKITIEELPTPGKKGGSRNASRYIY